MLEKPGRTVIWEAFLLGRKLLGVSSIIVGAGFAGTRMVRAWNDSGSAPDAAAVAAAAANSSAKSALARPRSGQSSLSSSVRQSPNPRMPFLNGSPPMGGGPGAVFGGGGSASPPEAASAAETNAAQGAQQADANGNPMSGQAARQSNGSFDGGRGVAGASGVPNGQLPQVGATPDPNATPAPAGALSDGSGGGPASTTGTSTDSTTTDPTSTDTSTTDTGTDPSPGLVLTSTLPTYVTTGSVFATAPAFSIEDTNTNSILTNITVQTTLAAFLDSACSSAADGTLTAQTNPISLVSGVATFANVTYSLPGHYEESIYLQGTTSPRTFSVCSSSSVMITQRFVAGSGFATLTSAVNGFAGAAAATRKNVPYAVDVDSAGRYYAGGMSTNVSGGNELFIARYFPDGTLDTSFATAGVFLYQNNSTGPASLGAAARNDQIYGLKIDSSGNVVASGITADSTGGIDVFLLRLTSVGALDTGFNTTGLLVLQSGAAGLAGGIGAGKDDEVSPTNALLFDSLGRYVLPISSENTSGGRESGVLAVTTAGVLDPTFGTNGVTLIAHGAAGPVSGTTATRSEYPEAMQVDGSGNLVATYTAGVAAARDALVVRYTYTGQLDTTFNTTSGFTTVHSALGSSTPSQLRIDSSGNIIVVEKTGSRLALFRLVSAGTADASFGTSGMFVFNTSGPSAGGNAAPADLPSDFSIDSTTGDYKVVGSSANSSGTYVLAQWHFLATGALDTSFGNNVGYLTFQNGTSDLTGYGGSGTGDLATGHGVWDTIGRVMMPVQTVNSNQNSDFALIRFLATGTVDK